LRCNEHENNFNQDAMAKTQQPSFHFRAQHLFWKAVDWIYPPRCASCGKNNTRWCAECKHQIIPIDHATACQRCDFPNIQDSSVCPDCRQNPPMFDSLRSVTVYQGAIRSAIHNLKYKSDIPLAEDLSQCLLDLFRNQDWQVDILCAVPLSQKRQRERGYNQSGLLAQNLALALSIPYDKSSLIRSRETQAQVGLNALERRENVKNAFTAHPIRFSGKRILLIDDVATTSATLSACAAALKKTGATLVYALTLARAVHLD
jgi:ComF family protein